MKTDSEAHAIRSVKIRFLKSGNHSESSRTTRGFSMDEESHSSEPPFWFSSYMNQMKTDLKQDITNDIVEKVSEILLRNTDLFNRRSSQGLIEPRLEDQTRNKETASGSSVSDKILHLGITCDNCNEPVCGLRFKCAVCNDYDLCEACDKIPNVHNPSHVFFRYRQPVDNNSGTFVCLQPNSGSTASRRKPRYPPGFFPRKVSPRRSSSGVKRTQSLASSSSSSIRRNSGYVPNVELIGFDYTRNLLDTSLLLSDSRKSKTLANVEPPVNENLLPCRRLLDFQLISNDSVPDGTFVSPSAKFRKVWHIRNTGIRPWGPNTTLKYSWGNLMLMTDLKEQVVPPLLPGEECSVGVQFQAPPIPGSYQSNWRLHCNGVGFGHRLTCIIVVVASLDTPLKETEENQLTAVADPVSILDEPVEVLQVPANDLDEVEKDNGTVNTSNIVEFLSSVHIDQENGQLSERKTPIKSQTGTPSNTPFDITPPKSYEKSLTPQDVTEDSDETASILSLSSCDSDSDYVKIPIPQIHSFRYIEPSTISWNDDVSVQAINSRASSASGSCDFVKVASVVATSDDKVGPYPAPPLLIEIESFQEVDPLVPHMSMADFVTTPNDHQHATVPVLINEVKSEPLTTTTTIDPQDEIAAEKPFNFKLVKPKAGNPVTRPPTVVSRETGVPEIPVPDNFENSAVSRSDRTTSGSETEPLTEQPTQVHRPAQNRNSPQTVGNQAQFPSNPYDDLDVPTIQVLPEGLVTGALTAAASVYNTARAIFSTIQNPEGAVYTCPDGQIVTRPPPPLSPMGQLMEMGFCNRSVNAQLLCKHNNDVNAVVADLLTTHTDNDWHTTRHQQHHLSVD